MPHLHLCKRALRLRLQPAKKPRGPRGSCKGRIGLAANAEFFNQPFVTGKVLHAKIIEQSAPLPYQAQQTTSRMMVFRVILQMASQLLDPRRKYSDLNFRRAAIVRCSGVSLDNFPFADSLERHQVLIRPFIFLADEIIRAKAKAQSSHPAADVSWVVVGRN
jgi:hypothetical protein